MKKIAASLVFVSLLPSADAIAAPHVAPSLPGHPKAFMAHEVLPPRAAGAIEKVIASRPPRPRPLPDGIGCVGEEWCAPQTVTHFPIGWTWSGAGTDDWSQCFGAFDSCGTSVDCREPPFAAPSYEFTAATYWWVIRPCNYLYGNGQMFIEERYGTSLFWSSGQDTYDGDAAVAFQIQAPRQDLTMNISADVWFQDSWHIYNAWPNTAESWGRISIYLVDDTAGGTQEYDVYPYDAKSQEFLGGGFEVTGTTGPEWYVMTDGISTTFASTAGHAYTVWIWAENKNNTNDPSGTRMSVQVNSVTYSYF